MDLTSLNLTEEQMTELEGHIEGEVSKAKENFKDFVSKEDLTKMTKKETDKVHTEYGKKLKALEDELVKYKPKNKSEAEIELEKRLKILEDKEKEITKKEKVMNIVNQLREQGLPKEFAKYLSDIEDEKLGDEIGNLQKILTDSRIAGSFKPDGHKAKVDSITKEQFNNMGYMERLNLFNSNKDLYEKLSQ